MAVRGVATSRNRLVAPGFLAGDITPQLANIPAAASPIDCRRHVHHRGSGEKPDQPAVSERDRHA
jgi:hypothetical protein